MLKSNHHRKPRLSNTWHKYEEGVGGWGRSNTGNMETFFLSNNHVVLKICIARNEAFLSDISDNASKIDLCVVSTDTPQDRSVDRR